MLNRLVRHVGSAPTLPSILDSRRTMRRKLIATENALACQAPFDILQFSVVVAARLVTARRVGDGACARDCRHLIIWSSPAGCASTQPARAFSQNIWAVTLLLFTPLLNSAWAMVTLARTIAVSSSSR